MENIFENKSIIITGATRGIGFELTKKLLNQDCSLYLIASKIQSFDSIKEYSKVNLPKAKLFFLDIDFSSEYELKKIDPEIEMIEKIDFLINNAGIGTFKKFIDLTENDLNSMINVNLKAPFILMQSVLRKMIAKNKGTILNVLSIVNKVQFSNSSVYGATKSALQSLSDGIRIETRDKGIKIVNMFPGAVSTEMWSKATLEKLSNKMMTPENVAETIFQTMKLSLIENIQIEEIQFRPQSGDL